MSEALTNEELQNVINYLNTLDQGQIGENATAFFKLYLRISEGCCGLINLIDNQHIMINDYQQSAMVLKRYYEQETGDTTTWPDIAVMISWVINKAKGLNKESI